MGLLSAPEVAEAAVPLATMDPYSSMTAEILTVQA
jgi:hypothetical protein